MLRIQQKLISFSIVSRKIAHNAKEYNRDSTLNFYPVVGLKDTKLGTISLNQPNNQNFFTTEMMSQFFRFLNSYQHDHSVENVWIQNRGAMFLGGISYQELANNPEYLDKLYKMIAMVAKLNKPMFSYATGGVRNVGAYVLSMAAVSLTDYSASMRIDQVSKGFIPVAGGSHRLSRLPAKIGFYLALTGRKLNSNEMSRLGFITAIVKQGVTTQQIRRNISRSNLFFRQKLQFCYKDQRDNEFEQWNKILRKKFQLESELQLNQGDIIMTQKNVFAKFAMNQYRLAQINFENAKKPFNSFSEKPGRFINNYYGLRHQKAFDSVQKAGLIQKSEFEDVRLPGFQIEKIIKFFSEESLTDVIKKLQNETDQWSIETLKQLRRMDPLAAVLTFQLLKRAEDLSWDQCLNLEYTVSKRLLSNSKLTLKQSFQGSKFVLTNKYSSNKIEQLPAQAQIEQYFSAAVNADQKLQTDIPEHSLYPTSDYRHIPDSPRLGMNQLFFDDIHLGNQHREIKRYLQNQKINYRHKSYNVHLLRQKIYNKEEQENIKRNESKRLEYILNNSSVLRNFIQQRNNYIDKMTNQEMQTFLTEETKNIFNDGIKARFQEFEKTASIIGKQRKLQIFKNLRKKLIQKVVINGANVEQTNLQQNQSYKGLITFDQEGQGIFQSTNSQILYNQNLNKISQQLSENHQLCEQFIQNEGSLPLQKDLGYQIPLSRKQLWMLDIQERIQKRYNEVPAVWNKAREYHEMVREAAKTSEQLAQYLEWNVSDYYNTILSAPAHVKTYAELGQQFVQKAEKEREQEKLSIRTEAVLSETFSTQYFESLYQQQGKSIHDSSKFIRQKLAPKFALNQEIQKFLGPTLELVLKHFEQKYFQQVFKQKTVEFGQFDRFIFEEQDKQFVELYKNDILFVYSYFAILKIKEVLHALKVKGIPQKQEQLLQFFRQHNIQFKQDRTVEFMNKVISKFLFSMLDLHTYTKAKIVLPQNKLLDFMNRVKIFRQTQKKSPNPLSFESLLLMIGKDRSKLYNKVIGEFIPTEPQYLLEMAHNNTKDQLNSEIALKGNHASSLYSMENSVSSQHLLTKSLIVGYQYYLALFDSFIHRAAGKYTFINEQTANLNPKQFKQQMRNIINLQQTPKSWFERVAKVALKNFFNMRLQYQKTLTKGQLLAFDQQMKQMLNPDTFRLVAKYFLESEIQETKGLFENVRKYSYKGDVSDYNEQIYCEIRKNVKNPDAFKRLNNLKMAMNVQSDYFKSSENRAATQEQKQDLVQEKKQFFSYERFPKETYKRIVNQTFSYGEEKNFDKYLNPIKDRQMDNKTHKRQLRFSEDERQTKFKKEEKFTDFEEQLKSLKHTIVSNESDKQQIDSIYRKIEELL